MDYFCAGYWNLSSFYKVFPRFFIPSYSESDSFFLFPRLESVESGLWSQHMEYLDLSLILRQVLWSHEIDSTSVNTDSVFVRIFEGLWIVSGQPSTYLKIKFRRFITSFNYDLYFGNSPVNFEFSSFHFFFKRRNSTNLHICLMW